MNLDEYVLLLIFLVIVVLQPAAGQCATCGGDFIEEYSEGDIISGYSGNETISMEKEAEAQVVKGETVHVVIKVNNGVDEDINVTLREMVGGAKPVDMGDFRRNTKETMVSAPPYYELSLIVKGGSSVQVSYEIEPLYYGKLRIPATTLLSSGASITSDQIVVTVRCDADGVCETSDDENAFTCPEDCKADENDGLCDPEVDMICDPDCVNGTDPDCGRPSTIPTTSTTSTTMETLRCGNSVCDDGEDYAACPLDCPSGVEDGFCDGLSDKVCDPDCEAGADPDCVKPSNPAIVITLAVILIMLFIAVAYKKRWFQRGD